MILNTETLQELKAKDTESNEPSEWRTFKFSEKDKARFLVKGINSKAYRVAQERITESLRLQCSNIRHVETYEDSSLAKHMTAIAFHLVKDWEGIYSKSTGIEVAFTHDNLATVLKYSGDLGIVLHGWILEQATDIQNVHNESIEVQVGKPWSFSDSMKNNLDPKSTNESESDSKSQESLNLE